MDLENIINRRKLELADELKSADLWVARRVKILEEMANLDAKLVEVADLQKLQPKTEPQI